jgi:hypothetical protein
VAAHQRKIRFFIAGVLFMTLAQVTRSGAVFVLPVLVIWGVFWLQPGTRARLAALFGGCSAIALGFILNRLLLEMGGSELMGFSNFSFTVYGLSVGEGGWSQIMKDHPDIIALTEPGRSQAIYALALKNIVHDPTKLLQALFRNFYLYTVHNGGLNIVAGSKAWLLVQIPTLLGVVWCARHISSPRYALLLLVFFGVLLSSLIVTEDGGLRVFAATVPFSAAIAAVGLPIKKTREITGNISSGYDRFAVLSSYFFSMTLILAIFITISFVPLESGSKSEEKISCGPDARLITIAYPARTAIHLRNDEQKFRRYLPNVNVNDFRESLEVNGRRRDWPDVELLQIPYSILSLGKYVLIPTSQISSDPHEITICAERKGWLFIDQRLLRNHT